MYFFGKTNMTGYVYLPNSDDKLFLDQYEKFIQFVDKIIVIDNEPLSKFHLLESLAEKNKDVYIRTPLVKKDKNTEKFLNKKNVKILYVKNKFSVYSNDELRNIRNLSFITDKIDDFSLLIDEYKDFCCNIIYYNARTTDKFGNISHPDIFRLNFAMTHIIEEHTSEVLRQLIPRTKLNAKCYVYTRKICTSEEHFVNGSRLTEINNLILKDNEIYYDFNDKLFREESWQQLICV